ncbi:hypothetical protein PHYPSEUDO_004356 [Phytophthora pseudosyringae]|uniref:Uncharacterized protein n=1 Tax=Phytophthora pseudosyringae TaxID=221518 RepID=A0A8T1VN99_9STRA|nr:hypothetical protein PHYPSEUDO_004356 [Phytophthora pseudosyringae]
MGNRISRKKRAPAAGAAPSPEAVVAAPAPSSAAPVQSDDPHGGLSAPKDEIPVEKDVAELPQSAPPTARDGDDSNEEDPLEFFRRCDELEADPFTRYTQALLLKDQRQFAAASELLRSLLPNPSLTLETRHHLAQCLVAQDPALLWCREEATQCLENVVMAAATNSSSNNADAHNAVMYRESVELLAHVVIAGKRFDRALQLLEALVLSCSSTCPFDGARVPNTRVFLFFLLPQQVEIDAGAIPPSELAAHRQQQTLASFQSAFCRYARGDSPDAVSCELLRVLAPQLDHKGEQVQQQEQQQQEERRQQVSSTLEGIELLLHADAASLREGFALLAATCTST